jgi:hypothetical protein
MLILLVVLFLMFGNLRSAVATPLEDLVAAAKKEGVTSAYEYAQDKRLLQMNQNQAQTVDRLARQYGKTLGFER